MTEESAPAPARSRSPPAPQPSRPKGSIDVAVSLLDGSDATFEVERKVKTADVIERAHTEIDTGERDFFSLFFFHDNQKIFVDPLKQLRHLIPNEKHTPWKLNYGVKFYVPDPSNLKEDHSRYLYCLQLCQDIKENRVLIDRETATRLTALMLQASVGDYDEETHQPGYTEEFVDFMLIPQSVQPENYEAQLIELHKAKAGYTPAQAESEFLEIARKLPRYGMHLFAARDEENNSVLIGNGYNGITIFKEETEVFSFPWPNIVKISYKRKKFKIRFREEDSAEDSNKVFKKKFFCGDHPANKRVWKNAVEQHTFFRLHVPEEPTRFEILFRRGSKFRYSGRTFEQTKKDKSDRPEHAFTRSHSERLHHKSYEEFAPSYVPSRDRTERGTSPTRHYVIGKRSPDEGEKWLILDRPPQEDTVDPDQFEKQKVQVDFRVTEGLPEDQHKFVIRRSRDGFQMQNASLEPEEERSYRLSVVDENSEAALTSVSLNIRPAAGASLQQRGKATAIFDSERMPVVRVNNAAAVTTTSVIESLGKELTSGVVSQKQYTSEEGADVSLEMDKLETLMGGEEPVGPAVDGSTEADQVRLFLGKEHELVQMVFSEEEAGQATHKEEEEITVEPVADQ